MVNEKLLKMSKKILPILIIFIMASTAVSYEYIQNTQVESNSNKINPDKIKDLIYDEEKNLEINTDIKNEIIKDKEFYVDWFIEEKKYDIDSPFFVSKDSIYKDNIIVDEYLVKNIKFILNWKDDKRLSFLNLGFDELIFIIKNPEKKEIYHKKTSGEGKINHNIELLDGAPKLDTIKVINEKDANDYLLEYVNEISKWKNQKIAFSIEINIGEKGFFRKLLDKGNEVDLEIIFEIYKYKLEEVGKKNNPPDTFILEYPKKTIDYNSFVISWTGKDDITPDSELEYNYIIEGKKNDEYIINSGWSGWVKDTSKNYENLPDGYYGFSVKSRDSQGIIDDTPAKVNFIILTNNEEDITPPDTNILSGPFGTIDYKNVEFVYEGNDDISPFSNLEYSYILDGFDYDWSSWNKLNIKNYNNLDEGSYIFKVRSRDESGNIDPSPAERSFNINLDEGDNCPPETMITLCPTGTIDYNTVQISWTGNDNFSPVRSLEYSYKLVGYDYSWSSWKRTTQKTYEFLDDGIYTFTVKARDEAGNIDLTPDEETFIIISEVEDESRFATSVVELNFGEDPHQSYMDPDKVIGGPRGLGENEGSLDVLSLGKNGDITFGFDIKIINGDGPDFIVFENPIYIMNQPGKVFGELLYVEVSTDGINFTRFPSISTTTQPGSIYPDDVENLAGVNPVYSNVDTNNIDPFDPDVSGGDPFDLDDLIDHPLVLSGDVDLNDINYIRLIDIVGDGSSYDSIGNPIYDSISMDNGADIDAVSIINYEVN